MLKSLGIIGLLALAAGCEASGEPATGEVASAVAATDDAGSGDAATADAATDPSCASSADPMHCRLCVPSPPRGTPDRRVCENAPGPPGSTCCAEVMDDGSCQAFYFDGTTVIPTKCMPDHP
jgi:hypothetical protein